MINFLFIRSQSIGTYRLHLRHFLTPHFQNSDIPLNMFIFCCSIFYQVTVKSNDTDQDVICMRGKNLKIEITITDEYSRKLRALTYTGLNSETLFVSVLIQQCVTLVAKVFLYTSQMKCSVHTSIQCFLRWLSQTLINTSITIDVCNILD